MFKQLPPEINEMIQKEVELLEYDLLMDSRQFWRELVDALVYNVCLSSFRNERNFTFDLVIHKLINEYQIDLIQPYEDRLYKLDYLVGHSFFRNQRGLYRVAAIDKAGKIGYLIFTRIIPHKWVWTIEKDSGLIIEGTDDLVRTKIDETKKLEIQ